MPKRNVLQQMHNNNYHEAECDATLMPDSMSVTTACVARGNRDPTTNGGVFAPIDVAEIRFYPRVMDDAEFVEVYQTLKSMYSP
jgi:hypothetical protein